MARRSAEAQPRRWRPGARRRAVRPDPAWINDDDIVPPEQTMHLRDVLRDRHVPHACLIFAGERHVFRSADVIDRAL